MEDEFIEDIKSQDKLRITQLQITCDDSVQMKKTRNSPIWRLSDSAPKRQHQKRTGEWVPRGRRPGCAGTRQTRGTRRQRRPPPPSRWGRVRRQGRATGDGGDYHGPRARGGGGGGAGPPARRRARAARVRCVRDWGVRRGVGLGSTARPCGIVV